jgi:micrococcal nuclease
MPVKWAIVGALVLASPALADPCTAPLPPAGTEFSGVVRYVGDGDSLCVGPAADPTTWIEVRLADFYAPELRAPGGEAAKATLTQLVKGRHAACAAGRRSYDRVVAQCTVNGHDIGNLMRAAGVREGGNGR